MIGASLNRSKRMEEQTGYFLKQLVVKLELGLLLSIRGVANPSRWSFPLMLTSYEKNFEKQRKDLRIVALNLWHEKKRTILLASACALAIV